MTAARDTLPRTLAATESLAESSRNRKRLYGLMTLLDHYNDVIADNYPLIVMVVSAFTSTNSLIDPITSV